MIKAIIFDVGEVLCPEGGALTQYIPLSKKFGFDLEKFRDVRRKHIGDALKNREPKFKYEILIAKELKVPSKKFIRDWQKLRKKDIRFYKKTKTILRKLQKNYLLGTLTNVTHGHDIIREQNGIYSFFKINLKSCDLGIAKPSPKIFKRLIRELKNKNIRNDEVIFIDDKENNAFIARKLGLKTILFKNNNHLIKDLRKMKVKI